MSVQTDGMAGRPGRHAAAQVIQRDKPMHDQTPDASSGTADSPPDGNPRRRKSPKRWPVMLVLVAMIVMPGVFWRQVWWGAPLSDDALNQRLSQTVSVREVQHALEQLSKRLDQDPATPIWFQEYLAAKKHIRRKKESKTRWNTNTLQEPHCTGPTGQEHRFCVFL